MRNPWHQLPSKAPFALPAEREIVNDFNAFYDNPQYQVHLEVLPEPFIGNPQAGVVVLSLNPGYDESDVLWHQRTDFAASIHANLQHEPQEYPFYPLNPTYSPSGAHRWWRKKLNTLIQDSSLPAVANNLLCVEWFPYHSYSYKAIPKRIAPELLPSQRYAIHLVEAAMSRGARIIAMRSYRTWEQHVPGLNSYPKVHHLSSAQSAHLSPGNMADYSAVITALKTTNKHTRGPIQ